MRGAYDRYPDKIWMLISGPHQVPVLALVLKHTIDGFGIAALSLMERRNFLDGDLLRNTGKAFGDSTPARNIFTSICAAVGIYFDYCNVIFMTPPSRGGW